MSRRNKSFVSEINVTPFVDVMMVLLIIFMVTAPMMDSGLDVDLPQAKQVDNLPTDSDHLVLTVRDDGCGFDPQALAGRSEGGHIGMNIMHERAERMGATISIDSAPGRGTCVTLTLPDSQRQAV